MKGIIIAAPKKYENLCLENVLKIRSLGCDLPVEIWEIGKELSDRIRTQLSKINNITFKNVEDYCDNPNHWKGFQVKAFMLYHTEFEELLLCDADVILYQNPILIFEDKNYLKKGAYFFKDLDKWKFSKLDNNLVQFIQKLFYNKFKNKNFFLKRKKWLLNILPTKSELFPEEWSYIYEDKIPSKPVKEALQESGVVFMNTKIQKKSIQNIYELNNNHPETYKVIWGDKETFWLGCVMANLPFQFNETSGYMSTETGILTHDYKGKKFFSQKG